MQNNNNNNSIIYKFILILIFIFTLPPATHCIANNSTIDDDFKINISDITSPITIPNNKSKSVSFHLSPSHAHSLSHSQSLLGSNAPGFMKSFKKNNNTMIQTKQKQTQNYDINLGNFQLNPFCLLFLSFVVLVAIVIVAINHTFY